MPLTDSAAERRALGAEGERLAAQYLARCGYRVVARNARAEGVELDLIALRGRVCVFVEVKTRRGRAGGGPEEAVDARKRERLVRGAYAWLHARRATHLRARFDVIAVAMPAGSPPALRHWPAAFDASG